MIPVSLKFDFRRSVLAGFRNDLQLIPYPGELFFNWSKIPLWTGRHMSKLKAGHIPFPRLLPELTIGMSP